MVAQRHQKQVNDQRTRVKGKGTRVLIGVR